MMQTPADKSIQGAIGDEVFGRFEGVLTNKIIGDMVAEVDRRFDSCGADRKRGRRLTKILIEQAQNLMHQGRDKLGEDLQHKVEVGKHNDTYYVETAGYIDSVRAEKLKADIRSLSTEDDATLRQRYYKALDDAIATSGRGLGLIEIARQARISAEGGKRDIEFRIHDMGGPLRLRQFVMRTLV